MWVLFTSKWQALALWGLSWMLQHADILTVALQWMFMIISIFKMAVFRAELHTCTEESSLKLCTSALLISRFVWELCKWGVSQLCKIVGWAGSSAILYSCYIMELESILLNECTFAAINMTKAINAYLCLFIHKLATSYTYSIMVT